MKHSANNKKKVNPLLIILIVIFAGVFCFSGYMLLSGLGEYAKGDNEYAALSSDIEMPEVESIKEDANPEAVRKTLNLNFSKLAETNPDIVGWIICPDTVINYPIVQGSDNDKYLHVTFDGTYNKNGCIFLDKDNAADFSDYNSVVYGHHMKSGKMFASLVNYKDEYYFKEHPFLYLYTPDAVYKLEVFSAYIDKPDADFKKISFADDDDFSRFIAEKTGKSLINTGVDVSPEDKIITLQTCTYEFTDARFIVHAKLNRMY